MTVVEVTGHAVDRARERLHFAHMPRRLVADWVVKREAGRVVVVTSLHRVRAAQPVAA